jgi:hypothetical protein
MDNDKNLIAVKFIDIKNNKDFGEYFPSGKANQSIINEINTLLNRVILNDRDKYLPKGQEICNSIKRHRIQWRQTKASVLVFCVVKEDIELQIADSLLDEIDSQNIISYLDKQGHINNVAKQNLQYIIDKHIDSRISTASSSKIGSINQDLNELKNGMKKNIQSIIHNVEDSKIMEERASKIKDSSYIFHQNSSELHRVSKMRRYRNFIIIGGFVLLFVLFVYFVVL